MSSTDLNTISIDVPDLANQVQSLVERDGYVILRDVIDKATCELLVEEVDRVEREYDIEFGQNEFEGFQTRRIFNLIARGPRFRELVINERVLTAVESLLGSPITTDISPT